MHGSSHSLLGQLLHFTSHFPYETLFLDHFLWTASIKFAAFLHPALVWHQFDKAHVTAPRPTSVWGHFLTCTLFLRHFISVQVTSSPPTSVKKTTSNLRRFTSTRFRFSLESLPWCWFTFAALHFSSGHFSTQPTSVSDHFVKATSNLRHCLITTSVSDHFVMTASSLCHYPILLQFQTTSLRTLQIFVTLQSHFSSRPLL